MTALARFSRSILFVACSLSAPSIYAAGIDGTVTGPDGHPLGGARVFLWSRTFVAAVTDCDANGAFRMQGLTAGPYELRVVLEGFRTEPIALTLTPDEDRRVTVRLELSALAESIVVSASQIDVPLSRTADSVTVMTSADLSAHQAETVAEVLRVVPGLSVAQSGGRGALTSVFSRGGESDFTLVLVDGIRVNAFGGGFDFSKLPAANVERVEVVRGPQSALYGSDAIGGIVHVLTRHDGPPSVEGLAEAGGLGTSHVAIATSGSRLGWMWGGTAERLASDGFRGLAPATGERVTNDDYRMAQGSFSLGWRNARGLEARGLGRILSNERGFPGPFGSNPIGAFQGVDRISRGDNDERQVGFNIQGPWLGADKRLRPRAQITYADLHGRFTSPFGRSDSGTDRFSARAQTDVVFGESTSASLGMEYQGERAESTFITGAAAQPIPIQRDIVGYFGEVRHATPARLTMTLGLRVEQIRRRRVEESPSPFAPRPAFGVSSVVSLNPKAALTYVLRPPARESGARLAGTRVHVSAGTGIRPPDALEIAFTDNPDLKPERTRSVDVGIAQAFAGGVLEVDATAFANRFDDLIVAVGRSQRDASRYRTDNIANAWARGLELSVSARAAFGLGAQFAYTFLDSTILAVDHVSNEAPSPFHVGDALLRRPRHQTSLDLTLVRGAVTAFAQVGARGRMLDVEPSNGADPAFGGGLFFNKGYAVVHLGAGFKLMKSVEIYARALNLFDRQYEEALGFPALGRTGIVGVRLAARR